MAFALVAVAQNAGAKPFKGFSFDYSAGKARAARSSGEIAAGEHHAARAARGRPAARRSTTPRTASCTSRPACAPCRAAARRTASANGLTLDVTYSDADGNAVDVAQVPQGMDLIAQIAVKNTGHAAARQPGADAAGAGRLGDPQ